MLNLTVKARRDDLERLLMDMVAAWDEVERWGVRCMAPNVTKIADQAKREALEALLEYKKAGE